MKQSTKALQAILAALSGGARQYTVSKMEEQKREHETKLAKQAEEATFNRLKLQQEHEKQLAEFNAALQRDISNEANMVKLAAIMADVAVEEKRIDRDEKLAMFNLTLEYLKQKADYDAKKLNLYAEIYAQNEQKNIELGKMFSERYNIPYTEFKGLTPIQNYTLNVYLADIFNAGGNKKHLIQAYNTFANRMKQLSPDFPTEQFKELPEDSKQINNYMKKIIASYITSSSPYYALPGAIYFKAIEPKKESQILPSMPEAIRNVINQPATNELENILSRTQMSIPSERNFETDFETIRKMVENIWKENQPAKGKSVLDLINELYRNEQFK